MIINCKFIKKLGDLEESLSTKSSSIDLISPVVSDVGNLKTEDSLATNSEAESVREANMPMFDLVKETSSENEKIASPAASPIVPQAGLKFLQFFQIFFSVSFVKVFSLLKIS